MAPELLFLFIQCSTQAIRGHQQGGEEVREISSPRLFSSEHTLIYSIGVSRCIFLLPFRLEKDIPSLICKGDNIRVLKLEQGEHLLEELESRMSELCLQRRLADTSAE